MIAITNGQIISSRCKCSGEEKLWYGESELATVTSDAGDWSGVFPVPNMFDNDANTYWHSDAVTRTKIITIDFIV